jgi:cysteine desulfurase/selenocysteine lyase
MSSSPGDERSGDLPPHELRALAGQLGDRGEAGGVPHNPGPSIVQATPGLAGAALAPPGVAFAADDPNTLGMMLARMANELGVSAAWSPVPTPESLTTGRGLSAPASPGTSPAVPPPSAGAPGSPPSDAISPQLVAMSGQGQDSRSPSPATAGGPSGSPTPESIVPRGGGTHSTGTPAEVRTPDLSNLLAASHLDSFSVPFASTSSHIGSPPAIDSHVQPTIGSSTSSADPGSQASPSGVLDGASLDRAPTLPTSSLGTAAPGRPGGVGMPASNAASPGGFPGAPVSVMPAAPSMPFAQHAEHLGNTGLGRFGVVPPAGGAALSSPGSLPQATLPNAHELHGFAGETVESRPSSSQLVTTSSPVQQYGTSPSPNAGTRDTAAPPTPGQGRTPADPTNLDQWSPFENSNHGRVGRLSLIGDDLDVEPFLSPDYQLPLTDDVAIDAPPGFTPLGTQQAAAPSITGGESRTHGERAIRQTSQPFDPYVVRKDFPILEERIHGKRLVWLDNGATTQKPRAVIDRITHYYEHENSNVHRAAHTLAGRATDAFESGRESTRKFLNAPSTSEIIFVRGATEGINLIANTWGVKHIGAGDEILITHLEHHANIVPWQMLCARVGAKLRVAPVDDRGDVILAAYEKLITPRTKLVAFTQVSNALGTITPAREMIEIAHRRGVCTMLDGAQAVSHMPVDVQQLGCDFYVFSGHKVFAPTGIGAIYGRKEILEDMPPWQGGGNMIADVTFENTVYQGPPWRFEAGTGNIADAAGLGAALDYVMRIGMNVIDRYEHDLLVYATEKLIRIPGLRMVGTAVNKAGVLSFVLDGQRTEDVGAALDKEGIAVRSGHHCAQPILRRFGLEASVRASLAFYNVREDIDALVDAVTRLQAHRRSVALPANA